MIKIFMTVRNRLGVTKKAISSIERNFVEPYTLHIYDNLTNYRIEEHFEYFGKLYKEGRISQIIFNTAESTFNCFSKAASSNFFGAMHEQDPNKDKVDCLLFMDNDIVIIKRKIDKFLRKAWEEVRKRKLNNVKIIAQRPGGIKNTTPVPDGICGTEAIFGKLSGSGFWCTQNNFFTDVGFLPLKNLIGKQKMHDQLYWGLCEKATKGERYILGIKGDKLCIHTGRAAGSICNNLHKRPNDSSVLEKIKFKEADKRIESLSYDEFLTEIKNDKYLMNDW